MEEVGPPYWRKSSRCSNTTCVEIAEQGDGSMLLRDSKNPDQSPLRVTRGMFTSFVHGIKSDTFDLPG